MPSDVYVPQSTEAQFTLFQFYSSTCIALSFPFILHSIQLIDIVISMIVAISLGGIATKTYMLEIYDQNEGLMV